MRWGYNSIIGDKSIRDVLSYTHHTTEARGADKGELIPGKSETQSFGNENRQSPCKKNIMEAATVIHIETEALTIIYVESPTCLGVYVTEPYIVIADSDDENPCLSK